MKTEINWLKIGGFGLLGVTILSFASCSVEVVDTGNRGVRTSFGKIESESLPEGLYFVNPFTQNMVEMDTHVLKSNYTAIAYTKDVQQADVKMSANYRLKPQSAHKIYQMVGPDWDERLVPQVIFSTVKNEFGKWDAVDIIARRSEVQSRIEATARANLASKSITLENLQITNIDYNDAFEKAVERKVVAVQDAIREQNRTKQVQEQGKQTVISAEAEAESMRIRANALAANQKLVEWEAVKRWNGALPNYMLGGGAMPFIKVN